MEEVGLALQSTPTTGCVYKNSYPALGGTEGSFGAQALGVAEPPVPSHGRVIHPDLVSRPAKPSAARSPGLCQIAMPAGKPASLAALRGEPVASQPARDCRGGSLVPSLPRALFFHKVAMERLGL